MARRARVKLAAARVTRTQAAAEFSRKKQKQRARQWKQRGLQGAGIAVLAYLGVGGWWLHHTGKIDRARVMASDSFWEMTADAGFRLDQIYLSGRHHADAAEVKAALAVESGTPILALPLARMQAKLESIAEVKSAIIARELPNRLNITLIERRPAALWQRGGSYRLVDAEGVVLNREKYPDTGALPVIVGEDAPRHVRALIALLAAEPVLRPQVAAAVRVGGRRWNVRLTNGVTVMLPQDKPRAAWERFARLVEGEGLLTKAIRSVDMRIDDRVFIMPREEQKPPITLTNARDT